MRSEHAAASAAAPAAAARPLLSHEDERRLGDGVVRALIRSLGGSMPRIELSDSAARGMLVLTRGGVALCGAEVMQLLEERLPCAPFYEPPGSALMARHCKPPSGQWDAASMLAARGAFVMRPKVAVVAPHLLIRRELSADPRFRVNDDPTRIICPCPKCKSNNLICRAGWAPIRYAYDLAGVICVMSETIFCKGCSKTTAISTLIADPEYLPVSVRTKYADLVLMKVGAMTWSLAQHIFISTIPMAKLAEQIAAPHLLNQSLMHDAYARFVEEQGHSSRARAQQTLHSYWGDAQREQETEPAARVADWPPFAFLNVFNSLLVPSADNIRTIFCHIGAILEPFLLERLLQSSPGRIIRSDGTRSLAIRSTGDGKVLVIIQGARGETLWWGVTASESFDKHLLPALLRLRARFERMGTLSGVVAWYTDTCCGKCRPEMLSKHVLVNLFPTISRRPYLDHFHALKRIGDTCKASSQAFATELKRNLSSALLQPVEEDIRAVASYLQAQNKSLTAQAALARVREDLARYKADGAIRSTTPAPEIALARLTEVKEKWEAFARSSPTQSPMRPASRTGERVAGTGEVIDFVGVHVANGCLNDPLPLDEMYLQAGRVYHNSTLRKFVAMRGDSLVEDLNSLLNPLVEGVSTVDRNVLQCRIFFRLVGHARAAEMRDAFGRSTNADGEPFWLTPALLSERSLGETFAMLRKSFFDNPTGGIGSKHALYEPMGWAYEPDIEKAQEEYAQLVSALAAERASRSVPSPPRQPPPLSPSLVQTRVPRSLSPEQRAALALSLTGRASSPQTQLEHWPSPPPTLPLPPPPRPQQQQLPRLAWADGSSAAGDALAAFTSQPTLSPSRLQLPRQPSPPCPPPPSPPPPLQSAQLRRQTQQPQQPRMQQSARTLPASPAMQRSPQPAPSQRPLQHQHCQQEQPRQLVSGDASAAAHAAPSQPPPPSPPRPRSTAQRTDLKQSLSKKATPTHCFQTRGMALQHLSPSERALAGRCLAMAVAQGGKTSGDNVFSAAQAVYKSLVQNSFTPGVQTSADERVLRTPTLKAFEDISRRAGQRHAAATVDDCMRRASSGEAAALSAESTARACALARPASVLPLPSPVPLPPHATTRPFLICRPARSHARSDEEEALRQAATAYEAGLVQLNAARALAQPVRASPAGALSAAPPFARLRCCRRMHSVAASHSPTLRSLPIFPARIQITLLGAHFACAQPAVPAFVAQPWSSAAPFDAANARASSGAPAPLPNPRRYLFFAARTPRSARAC